MKGITCTVSVTALSLLTSPLKSSCLWSLSTIYMRIQLRPRLVQRLTARMVVPDNSKRHTCKKRA